MKITAIIIVISILLIWVIYDLFIKRRLNKPIDFIKNDHQRDLHTNVDRLHNSDKKPDDYIIQTYLDSKLFKLYKIIKDELRLLGTPDLIWRGEQNGWVLSIVEDNGTTGSIILHKDKFVGQLGMTRNQVFGIRTDERFPKVFDDELNLSFIRPEYELRGGYFEKVKIDNEEKAKGFVKLIELNKYYNNYS